MAALNDSKKVKNWNAVEILAADKVVYVGVVDKINFTGNVACRVFMFLNGGETWRCINEEPVAQKEAEFLCKKQLYNYFDSNGYYPKYNQEEFIREWKRLIKPYCENWHEPIAINKDTIDSEIEDGHKNGNYIYGHYEDGKFIGDYVGRCTNQELRERIKHRLDPKDNNYAQFNERGTSHVKFRYAQNDDEAINIECLLYHYYGGRAKLINNEHPSLDDGRKCPVTNCDKS